MDIAVATATLHTKQPVRCRAEAVRGFFGRKFPENILLHQHIEGGGTAYLYPRVQYRVTRGVVQLVGVEDGIIAIQAALGGLAELDLNGTTYQVNLIDVQCDTAELGEAANPIEYRFGSPWLALSQKNYARYRAADHPAQDNLLRRTLIGNVLSMCKSLGVVVTEHLRAELCLRPQQVVAKRQHLLGFVGRFRLNFQIPAQLGLGHLVSFGFGQTTINQRAASFARTIP